MEYFCLQKLGQITKDCELSYHTNVIITFIYFSKMNFIDLTCVLCNNKAADHINFDGIYLLLNIYRYILPKHAMNSVFDTSFRYYYYIWGLLKECFKPAVDSGVMHYINQLYLYDHNENCCFQETAG